MPLSALRRLLQRKFVQDTLVLQVSRVGVTLLGLVAWVIVPVALGSEQYGIWVLVQSVLTTWQTLDFTGITVSMGTLLATAVGAGDTDEILDLLSVYVKAALAWAILTIVVLMLAGPVVAQILYRNTVMTRITTNPFMYTFAAPGEIGTMAGLLALTLLFDPLYALVLLAFRSRRQMHTLAVIQNVNQVVLTACLVVAALTNPTPLALITARLVYSVVTLVMVLVVYQRLRSRGNVPFPSIGAVVARVRTAPYRRHWRFGAANALDKNLADLSLQIPIQMTGILAGSAAVGHLQLALRGIQQTGLFTSAIFDNMQAVIPQAVGRGDYARLWRNFSRVLVVLTLGGILFYGAVALFAPLLIVPLFGEEWLPVLPLIAVLGVYGFVTTTGGIFGPLYRAFHLMRAAILAKVAALAIILPLGAAFVFYGGALGGAWAINGMYILSVGFTALVTLPELRRRAG